MRQGLIVTVMLCVVGIPTALIVDGGSYASRAKRAATVAAPAPTSATPDADFGFATGASTPVNRGTAQAVRGPAANAVGWLADGVRRLRFSTRQSDSPYLLRPDGDQQSAAGDVLPMRTRPLLPGATELITPGATIAPLLPNQDYAAALRYYALASGPEDAEARYAMAHAAADRGPADDGDAVQASAVARWLRDAAELGHARARLELAGMYVEGNGVARDYPTAWMWYMLAERGLADQDDRAMAADGHARVAASMTADETARADALLAGWDARPTAAGEPSEARGDPAASPAPSPPRLAVR
jgi:TPR repeat protein